MWFNIGSDSGKANIANVAKGNISNYEKLEKVDVEQLKEDAKTVQEFKNNLGKPVFYVTDEAYHVIHQGSGKLYAIERDENGEVVWDKDKEQDGKKDTPKYYRVSEEEQENLQASAHGGANVLQHGIFTSKDAAAQYTVQINPENGKYFIYFPKANNMVSELLVAGYQKFMENDFWGLSKSAELGKEFSVKYGTTDSPMPIHFDVYSRGGLTKGSEL